MSFTRLGWLIVLLLSLTIAQPFAALAQTNAPDQLPPAAQEAMEKGLIAAKQQEYLMAIKFFQDARKIAPAAPVLFFNLGLAESKIAGRELRAMTWFGAYLEASPGAANVAAVKQQIKELDIKNQASLARLIRTAEDTARQGDEQMLGTVAGLWAKSGDLEAAVKIANSIADPFLKDNARESIAKGQAEAGDTAGALKTADSITAVEHPDMKDYALSAIAEAQAKAGDLIGARNTAESIHSDRLRDNAHSAIDTVLFDRGYAQADAGDFSGAHKTLESISKQSIVYKKSVQMRIATKQAETGDIASAQKIADSIQDVKDRATVQKDIALAQFTAQVKAGDFEGANKTADSIQEAEVKGFVQSDIVTAQAKAGDIAGAQKTAGGIRDANRKSWALYDIALAQAEAGDILGAQTTTDSIQKLEAKGAAQANIAKAQAAIATAKASTNTSILINPAADTAPIPTPTAEVEKWIYKNDGLMELNDAVFLDLATHLKSLPPDKPMKVFFGLVTTVDRIVYKRQVITRMLKQQGQPPGKTL